MKQIGLAFFLLTNSRKTDTPLAAAAEGFLVCLGPRLAAFALLTVLLASVAMPQATTTTTKKTVPAKKGKSSKKSGGVASRQMTPTPDRYRDIQRSLAEKGYLKSEPNGVWDAQSSDALLRFQTDQKLTPTGKISAATLIALGLGPKTAPVPPPPASPNSER